MLRVKNFVPGHQPRGLRGGDRRPPRQRRLSRRSIHAMNLLKSQAPALRHFRLLHQREHRVHQPPRRTSTSWSSWGAYFVWYFHYMPVGNDAAPELLPDPGAARVHVPPASASCRAQEAASSRMDFQNDGEYVGGCIAGGRRYLHINANGDVDPCVFIHYSDSNIREKHAARGAADPRSSWPITTASRSTTTMLRPCPMLENPRDSCARSSRRPAPIPPICSPRRPSITCAPSATNTPRTGSRRLSASGPAATIARPAARAAERRTDDAYAVYLRERHQGASR